MSSNPTVTVYVTNHNYGRFIERAIESVLSQTLRDFELIIIDDGSTDGSREIIERYGAREGIRTVFQHNKGLNVTNNIAARMARGKYIMRLDADDYLEEHALAILSGVLDRNPTVGLVFPDYVMVDEEGRLLEVVRRHNFDDVTLLDQPAHGACTLVRRECLLEIGGYDESFRCQDGYDLWVRFIQKYGVQNVNLPLFYYRQHGSSLTRNEERILSTRSKILEKQARRDSAKKNALAILPVRGAAIDARSQALRTLGKRTLLDWTIEAALEAERTMHIIVTTPDKRILEHVDKTYQGRVIGLERDRRLAEINTHVHETIAHALAAYAKAHAAPENLVVLSIESPFRHARHVDAALDVLDFYETDTVVGVRPETDTFYKHDGGGLHPLRTSEALRLEADDLFRRVGDMSVVRRAYFEQHKRVVGGRIGHVVLDPRSALRLASDWDWRVAELIAASEEGAERAAPEHAHVAQTAGTRA